MTETEKQPNQIDEDYFLAGEEMEEETNSFLRRYEHKKVKVVMRTLRKVSSFHQVKRALS